MSLPIGLQLYTVRDAMDQDVAGTLAEVAAIGYTHVELAGLYGRPADEIKALLDDANLIAIGAHDGWAMGDPAEAAATARTIGYAYVMQPWWPEDQRTAAGYGAVVDRARKAAAAHPGLTFGYHNHDFEFGKTDTGRSGYEVLFDGTDLTAEMDTAWVAIAGEDVTGWMRKLSGRVPLLHIKDASDFDKPTLCEVGTGKVPVADILAAAEGVGAKALVVEQDNNWIDGDCLKSAKVSFENLKKML